MTRSGKNPAPEKYQCNIKKYYTVYSETKCIYFKINSRLQCEL